jgi:uncharacterized membrane protein HdeD (DUF308 family)
MLVQNFTTNWWGVALRGAAAVIFGILALLLPGLTLAALVLLFGAYAIVDGVSAIATGLRGEKTGRNWLLVVMGAAGVVAGLLTWFWPGLSALALLVLIGWWAIVTGVLEIAAAYRLRSVLRHEWLVAFSGGLSVLFGIFVLLFPGAGALALVWLIGWYAIVSGVALLVLAFRLRGHGGLRTEGNAA